MVTKHSWVELNEVFGLILAKIHMVTKLRISNNPINDSLILAKIHMVTKPCL